MFYVAFKRKLWAKLWGWMQASLMETEFFVSSLLTFSLPKHLTSVQNILCISVRRCSTAAVRGSKPHLVMWDLWWDKVALGQVCSQYFGFPCNRRSLHQLLHNHPHVSSGEWTIGQCGRSAGTYRDLGDLKTRDLRNLNLGDLKKEPKGA
jgi:hypothetical protein